MSRNARKFDDDNIINLQEKGDVMGLARIILGVKKNKDGSYNKTNPNAGTAKMLDAAAVSGVIWPMKLVWYMCWVVLWFIKLIIVYPWGNVVFGAGGIYDTLNKYFGWVDREPNARDIELGGSFDYTYFSIFVVLLTVGIIRLVGREWYVRNSEI